MEKYELILLLFPVLIGLFIIVLIAGAIYYDQPDKDEWCERNKPRINDSQNIKISYCYNEGWKDYCKIRYPEYCPEVNKGSLNIPKNQLKGGMQENE